MGSWELPGYDVLDLLGSSASGEVWRGRDRGSGETVALRRVRCADREASERLRARVSRAAGLAVGPAAEHLIRVRATVPVTDGFVLVLDHAPGGSLASVLAARGRLAPGEVVTVGVPIAGVLAMVHAAGVACGRVSATNVLFTLQGKPLLDLPAVAGDVQPADDVYALAALCWIALGGAAPVPGAAPPPAPAGVPSALATAVGSGLAPDPAARPTAAAWAAALRSTCAPAAVRLVRRVEPAQPEPNRPGAAPPAASASGSMASTAPAPRHRRRAEGQAEGKGETRRRGGRRLLVRGFAAVVVVAAAVTFGSALSRVDHASTAAPLPGASSPVRSPSPSTAETAGRGPDWRQVLVALDARRSEAFARGESLALARVYAAGSRPLARDTEALRRLVAAGVTAPGLRLEVSQVRPLSVEPRRALLSVVDRLPAHDLIARDGTVREHRPGRGPQAWQITVVPAPGRPAGEWRIAAVERVLS